MMISMYICVGLLRVLWVFFFFSSRRRHTRLVSDWSSDVCSSDLGRKVAAADREDKSKAAGERTGGTQGGNSGARGRQCKCKCVRSSPAWSGVDDCDRNSSRSVIKIEVCRINIRGQLRSANNRGGARGIVP